MHLATGVIACGGNKPSAKRSFRSLGLFDGVRKAGQRRDGGL